MLVNGLSNGVHGTAEGLLTDGDMDGHTSIDNLLIADETHCSIHSNGADRVFANMRSDLEDEAAPPREVLNLKCDGQKVLVFKLSIDNGTDNGFYGADLSLLMLRALLNMHWMPLEVSMAVMNNRDSTACAWSAIFGKC